MLLRKIVFGALMICLASAAQAQQAVYIENFDGNTVAFQPSPAQSWVADENFYTSSPKAYLGTVPNLTDQETTLESPVYDFSLYPYVYLQFNHICKVSPQDEVRVEYSIAGQDWQLLPASAYLGVAAQYAVFGFSAASYPEWRANDSIVMPDQTWWKNESFDLSFEVAYESTVQFRFVIKHGAVSGSQIAYGWLLDDIQITASPVELKKPLVQLMTPSPAGNVNRVGPFVVQASIKSTTSARILTPKLHYTSLDNGIVTTDSVDMLPQMGDSIWANLLPVFNVGTQVAYYVVGTDSTGNFAMAGNNFTVTLDPGIAYDSNSAALDRFLSPVTSQVIGGTSTPVTVFIRNMGFKNLTSATINWEVNGVAMPAVLWTGNLPWNLIESVELGQYIPRTDLFDTIKATISLPNGAADPQTNDDQIQIITYGCSGGLANDITIGTGGMYQTWRSFLQKLQYCGVGGDITLKFMQETHNYSINLTNIENYMQGHVLTLTSVNNDTTGVIIKASSGSVMTLRNSKNIVIQALTLDASSGDNIKGVTLDSGSVNVTIRDCRIVLHPTSTNTGAVGIYKMATGADTVRIIHNDISGGYYGMHLERRGLCFIIDSNTITNPAHGGIRTMLEMELSASHNRIIAQRNIWYWNLALGCWFGISTGLNCTGDFVGNHIFVPSTITNLPVIGLMLMELNANPSAVSPAKVYNNEIILHSNQAYNESSFSSTGIYMEAATASVLNNSIYYSGNGDGDCRGLDIFAYGKNPKFDTLDIKYNNIVMAYGDNSYPILLRSGGWETMYRFDHNNMYAPQYTGFASEYANEATGRKKTIGQWQAAVTTDKHSFSLLPSYVDPTQHLELTDYTQYAVPVDVRIPQDIQGTSRTTLTAAGCYHSVLPAVNAELYNLEGCREFAYQSQSDTIKAVIFNAGLTPLTSIQLAWVFNSVWQTPVNWTGNLAPGEMITIPLDVITYTATGNLPLIVYIYGLGGLTDTYQHNDTLFRNTFVCPGLMSGQYVVGSSGSADFATLTEAVTQLAACNAGGDVTFALEAGNYAEDVILTNISDHLNGYRLTVTSLAGNQNAVTVSPTYDGFTLNNSNRITIKDITIDSRSANHALYFKGACRNVIVRDCRLIGNNSNRPIYSEYVVFDSISFIHNTIDSGNYGIHFIAGSNGNNMGTNIVCDSNLLRDIYQYGIQISYANLNSFSGNRIICGGNTEDYLWYGMQLSECNGNITGNRIEAVDQTVTTSRIVGMNISNHNSTASDMALIANNEIIIQATGTAYQPNTGIALNYSRVAAVYNSIYGYGSQHVTGILVNSNASYMYPMQIKYNNIRMASTHADVFPIDLRSLAALSVWDIDHNNMSAPQYIARVTETNLTGLNAWREIISTDSKSFSIVPNYTNVTQDLKQNSYAGFSAPARADVPVDIDGVSRGNITHVGCYHGVMSTVDAEVFGLTGWRTGTVSGQSDMLQIVIANNGSTPLTDINFAYVINGGATQTFNWTGNLASGVIDTINLGQITYIPGMLNITAYIVSLGGGLTDVFPANDTASVTGYICSGGMQGVKVIGSAPSDFPTIKDALAALPLCGVSGDLTFAFKEETHTQNVDLTNISNLMNGYTLTLTSVNEDPTNAIIQANVSSVITLNNSHNISIRALTIDNTNVPLSDASGIRFTGACSHIVIRDCYIRVTNSQYHRGIYNAYQYQPLDHISIINNAIDGGSCGIEIFGNDNANIHIVCDSNTVTNTSQYGIYLFNGIHCESISHNTVISRATSLDNTWKGISVENGIGDIVGNRISTPSVVTTKVYGIYLTNYHWNNTTQPGGVFNNEIRLLSSAANNKGIAIGDQGAGFFPPAITTQLRAQVAFNSIYCSGGGATAKGIYTDIVNPSPSTQLMLYGNNIVMDHNNAAPIYIDGYYNPAWYIDYNNIHAPQYAGYVNGSNRTGLAAWQGQVVTDLHSVSIMPVWDGGVATSLKIISDEDLQCPLAADVKQDIEGKARFSITQMGAYTIQAHQEDMAALDIVRKQAVPGETFSVEAAIANSGLATINDAVLKWSKGGVYQGKRDWTAVPPMPSEEVRNVVVGDFVFDGTPVEVKVWIDSLNNGPDTVKWNDTVAVTITAVPLAWFTDPLVEDTVTRLDFDVHAIIMEGSGALTVQPSPELYIRTVIAHTAIEDTLPMTFADGKWSAHVPPQYYGSKVIYWLHVEDTVGNVITIMDSTYIDFGNSNPYSSKNLSLMRIEGLNFGNVTCLPDYVLLDLTIHNTGNAEFDFSQDNLHIRIRTTQPVGIAIDTVISTGSLASKGEMVVSLQQPFPIMVAGEYDIVCAITASGDNTPYDDTLPYSYVSGLFGLPIDEDFSNGTMDIAFHPVAEVGSSAWHVIPQGSGADADATPQFGNGILAFTGNTGSMTRLYTRQLDLSRTIDPTLSFWYFHDTAPSQDYMEVRVTIDGGSSYTTIASLRRQWHTRGWQQYSVALPAFAVNQCVFIAFEAMIKDRNNIGWQYIDRIRITAKQDLAITSVFADITACDMQNKEWKVVLSNLTDPSWNYGDEPINLTLRVTSTGQTYTKTINSSSVGSFASDTVTMATGVDFALGEYELIAYFDDNQDDNRHNDTFKNAFIVNPHLHLVMDTLSKGGNCLTANAQVSPQVNIFNDGNLLTEGIVLTVEIADEQGNILQTVFDTLSNRLQVGDSVATTVAYTVPDTGNYFTVNVFASLLCGGQYSDSSVVIECIRSLSVADWNRDGIDMSQNIPNPAKGNTKVNYSIPEDGRVVFSVYTVMGQTLIRKAIDAVSGSHSIEFDVADLAAGIYYYSMDYQGRKIVKKMNIRK
jgi:hypothetical protein